MFRFVVGLCLAVLSFKAFAAGEPMVYTGYLHYDSLQKDQLVRIFIQKSMRSGTTSAYYSAEVMLYFGEAGGTEYADLYYEPIAHNPTARQFFLQRDDDARGRRLPTIKLTYDEAGDTLTGSFTSTTAGYIGQLSLTKGWNPATALPQAGLLQPLAGIYDAVCNTDDGSAMSVDDLELVPSRIFTDKVSPEGSFNAIDYLGTGNCAYDGPISCVAFASGTYDFFHNTVHLMQGAWAWECSRSSSDELSCKSTRYPDCHLTRRSRTVAPTEGTVVTTPVRSLTADVPTDRLTSTDCSAWDGAFTGVLTHALSHKTQNIRLTLNTFAIGGTSTTPRCQLTAAAQLFFQDGPHDQELMTYPVPQVEIDGGLADQMLYSDTYTDLVLDIHQDEGGNLSGSWYSKLFGYVGRFTAVRNTALAPATAASVPGVKGSYRATNDTTRRFDLSSTEAGFDKYSHDPYVQLAISGSVTKEAVIDGRTIYVPDAVGTISYDYFTGYLVIRTGAALYYGFQGQTDMTISGMPRSYMAMSHPFDYHYNFRRLP